jgi:hypothetical protein
MRLRLHAEMQKTVVHDTSQRIGLTFQETINIAGVDTSVTLCESCYVHINNEICERTFANFKKQLKKRMLFDAVGASDMQTSIRNPKRVKDSTKTRFRNIVHARKVLGHLDLDESCLHLACLPDSPASLQAYKWLTQFFELVGDKAPNRDNKVQLPGIYTKSSIYDIYVHHVTTLFTGDEHEPLSKSSFLEIWKNVYPNVTLTKFCQVSGKCSTCHWLYERQEVFKSEKELEAIKYFASIHKVLIQMERSVYMRKRQLAQERPDLYMSVIIDGMSQDHCILPFLANKNTRSVVLKQKIVGAKQHGFSRTFYRTFPHVSSGSNVAVEVLTREIERRMDYCKIKGKVMPNWLFVQIDGGPENTSKTFYAFCDQLVKLKIFKRIEVSRLPVGHTHEDIDALFGVLWKSSRKKTMITPQDWKRMAMETFEVDYVEDDA